MSTTLEMLVTGIIAGTLAMRLDELGWRLEVPGYAEGEAEARIVLCTPSGFEVLVTVTETRTPPKPEP